MSRCEGTDNHFIPIAKHPEGEINRSMARMMDHTDVVQTPLTFNKQATGQKKRDAMREPRKL